MIANLSSLTDSVRHLSHTQFLPGWSERVPSVGWVHHWPETLFANKANSKRTSFPLLCETLEERNAPNDGLHAIQGGLLGAALFAPSPPEDPPSLFPSANPSRSDVARESFDWHFQEHTGSFSSPQQEAPSTTQPEQSDTTDDFFRSPTAIDDLFSVL